MITRIALSALLMAAAVFASVFGFWFQARTLPVQSRVVEVLGPAYPGGKLLVRWKVYRAESCAADKQELIFDVDGLRWVLIETHFQTAPGPLGFDEYTTQTPLPADLPVGIATLRVSLSYVCNPVHKLWPVVDRIPDIPVKILARPPDA
jgi:hypothetical protein